MTQYSARVAGATLDRVIRLWRLVLLVHVVLAIIGGISVAIPWSYEFNNLRPNGRALFPSGFGVPGVLLFCLWPYVASYVVFAKRNEPAPARYFAYLLAISVVCLSSAAATWYLTAKYGQVLIAAATTTIQYLLCAVAAKRLLREANDTF
jgi:drug/metabolite transporter (DMT)-like permease